ncbi:MAG: beta-galactosidase [Verrucomicrobia bacterium]|nr:beta-galactosidase [Verrucomicrobiota bacterium]
MVGPDASVTYPLSGNLNPAGGTLCFWAKQIGWTGETDQYRYLVTLAGDDDWILLQTAGSDLAFLGGKRNSYGLTTTLIAGWPNDRWRYLVATWDNGRNRIYLDGKPATKPSAWPIAPANLGNGIRLGGQLFGRSTGGTALDELQIFPSSATEEQVKALYQAAIQSSPTLRAEDEFLSQQQKREPNNVAKTAFGAMVLPSSQSPSPDATIENVFDGNFDTRWLSAMGAFPNWIEVRWPQPVTLSKLVVNESFLHKSAQYRIDACRNGKWFPVLPPKANPRKAGEQIVETFAPVETTKIRYYLLAPEGDPKTACSSVLELQACSASETADLSWVQKPSWKSNWIWYPEDNVDDVVRYFRKHFQIGNPSSVPEAKLQIAADDTYEVYLNGKFVGNGGIPTDLYDVKSLLVAGDNVLAVKCHEFSIFEGLIAELALTRADGSVERIVTDKTWKSSNRDLSAPGQADEARWQEARLDDRDWKVCKEEGMPPNCLHHASQEYFDKGVKETFRQRSLQTTPAEIKPGMTVDIRFEMETDGKIQNDYAFVLRVGEKPVALHADYTVAATTFLPPKPTSQWAAGRKQMLTAKLHIPDWAPHGDFPIFLTPVGRGLEGVVGGASEGMVGRLKIKKFDAAPKAWPAEPPQTEVKYENGHPTLYVNGKVVPPFIMTEMFYPSYESIGEHAKTGIHVWRIYAQKGIVSRFNLNDKKAENEEFFAALDQEIECLLKVDPDACILVGTGFDVSQAWTDKYPDDATLLADGRRLQHSFSSRRWIEESLDDARELVKHLLSRKYSGHIIGLHTALGGETYYHGLNANTWDTKRENIIAGDYSPEHNRAFRLWLKEKYGNDVKAFQSAWKNDAVTFEIAKPDIQVLRKEDLLVFRDPARTRLPMDYWEFHSDVMAQRLIDFGKAVKEASGGRYLTGFWGLYGDGFNAAGATPGRLHHCAYAGLQKVLESPHIDYIALLHAYAKVRWGTPAIPISLTESIRRHKKMLLVEYDTRTFFTPLQFTDRTYSQQETLSVLKRNIATSTVRGDALWWVGFREGATGRLSMPWFAEDSIVETLREGRKIYSAAYRTDLASVSEVAVFMNNTDLYGLDLYRAPKLLGSLQYNSHINELPKLGAPYDLYHLDDIALSGMDRYKVYVFANAFTLNAPQRKRIQETACRPGKTVVWVYAPGFSDGLRLSVENIKRLTGFAVGVDAEHRVPEATIESGHRLTQALAPGYRIKPSDYQGTPGFPFEIGPIFHVQDSAAEVLGKYVHNGKTAIASKEINGATSVYLAIPCLNAALLRSICRAAGVHFYCDGDLLLDANRHLIAITATADGFDGVVALPAPNTVYDVFERRMIGKNLNRFQASVRPLTTALYYYGSESEVKKFAASLD